MGERKAQQKTKQCAKFVPGDKLVRKKDKKIREEIKTLKETEREMRRQKG